MTPSRAFRCFSMRFSHVIATTFAPLIIANSAFEDTAGAQSARLDALLSGTAHRLLVANAPLCRRLMPGLGVSLISRDQFPSESSATVHPSFPGGSAIALSAVASGSPASESGLQAGDSIWLIDGNPWPVQSPEDQFYYQTAYSALAQRNSGASIVISFSRGDYLREAEVDPQPACRALVEILYSDSAFARTDGEIVQISSALAANLDASQLAVVLAHELGHVVLEHRRRLEEAGVKKGLLAEFGKNARRNRRAEIEADRLSVHLLANAGYDPALAPEFWLSDVGRQIDGGWMRSRAYPGAESRARSMTEEIDQRDLTASTVSVPSSILAWRDQSIDIED